jgi:hypothetical protein
MDIESVTCPVADCLYNEVGYHDNTFCEAAEIELATHTIQILHNGNRYLICKTFKPKVGME